MKYGTNSAITSTSAITTALEMCIAQVLPVLSICDASRDPRRELVCCPLKQSRRVAEFHVEGGLD
jgi:hypothetical protein